MSYNISNTSDSNPNAYVFLCYKNDMAGDVGIAWRGGTCNPNQFARSSIVEYARDDVTTASVYFQIFVPYF